MIDIVGLTRHHKGVPALENVSLTVSRGELLALVGPSGSGKTTLLRILAGLDAADAGTIEVDGEDFMSLDPVSRRVGFVFQNYALFRHMSVFENVAFGLRVRPREGRPSKADIKARVMKLLGLVRLEGLCGRRPAELSGGQRQRVALARALAIEPRILLLDEPFGALDATVRQELRTWLRRLHDEIEVTSIFVTHDQDEALSVADRIAVLRSGRIEQLGPPAYVYAHPETPFVCRFLGESNELRGVVTSGRLYLGDAPVEASASVPDGPAVAYVRPHDIDLDRAADGAPGFRASVVSVHVGGRGARVDLASPASRETISVEVSRERQEILGLRKGDTVQARVRRARIFPSHPVAGK